ncbi:hypothetical protein, partial [Escherichia coli]
TRIADFSLLFMKYQGIYFMKKTLIALTVAASTAISGSAMAAGWEQNGTGGSVELGGMLTPDTKVSPWEVKVGDAVKGLDAKINKGQKTVDIAVKKAIPILGIRTQTMKAFTGQDGVTPQIDYNGAINASAFSDNATTLTLDVMDAETSKKIGKLEAIFSAGAIGSYQGKGPSNNGHYAVHATRVGDGFFGGVSKEPKGVNSDAVKALLSELIPDVADHFDSQKLPMEKSAHTIKFRTTENTYSAYYASGVRAGQNLEVTLDSPASGDTPIKWKASLPVTVTYM